MISDKDKNVVYVGFELMRLGIARIVYTLS